MSINHIFLEGEDNARDLGGYVGADGGVIKMKRLIRSGKLSGITERDIAVLRDEYDLRAVVDFRTSGEKKREPDVVIPGVAYHDVPIFDERVDGITHEKKKDLVPDFNSANTLVPERMVAAYGRIAGENFSRTQYAKFFRVLLDNPEGSVLWHCTMGKDRAGMATVYLLSVLGVDREVIVEDYLATNGFCTRVVDEVMADVMSHNPNIDPVPTRRFFCADRDYIGEAFRIIDSEGGMLPYIEKYMGVGKKEIEQLREMYLQ